MVVEGLTVTWRCMDMQVCPDLQRLTGIRKMADTCLRNGGMKKKINKKEKRKSANAADIYSSH